PPLPPSLPPPLPPCPNKQTRELTTEHNTTAIHETAAWAALKEHAASLEGAHLRDLMSSSDRCSALTAEREGILLDYSRQRVTNETMDMLFNLAEAADLAGKRAAMYTGEKINNTEDRSVMHVALRAPKDAVRLEEGE
ncbi:unnamed protein product, partial [Laminaria digitata]